MNKNLFLSHILKIQRTHVDLLQGEMSQLQESLEQAGKSSVGDKHETSRAHVQLAMENLGKSLLEAETKLSLLNKMATTQSNHNSIQMNSLANVGGQWYYIGAALGKVEFQKTSIFCMSSDAPLAKRLVGQQVGDSVTWQDKTLLITEIN